MKKIFYIFMFSILFAITAFAQDEVKIGSNLNNYKQTKGELFDYSHPSGINLKIQLWCNLEYPGCYMISSNSTLNYLLSLSVDC